MEGKRVMAVLAVVALVFALSTASYATFSGFKICLDAGHGGTDPGAVALGDMEKDFNLDIALRARGLFQQDGATVVMTRTTDVFITLQGRCDIANNNGCNRFLASHCNAGGGTGTETFCKVGAVSQSVDFRNKVNPELVAHMGTVNRGVKEYNFYQLVHTSMPAILTEVAFMDTQADNDKLSNPAYRQEAARAYLHGTQTHYGISPHDPTSDIIVDNTSAAFSCSANWATGTMSADKYGSDYRYRATAAVSDMATWAPALTAGNYAIYAWWPAGSNRSSAAPYRINHTGGTTAVPQNQQINGGKWNYLGAWSFVNGNSVQLSCWATTGYQVVADAVKFVAQ